MGQDKTNNLTAFLSEIADTLRSATSSSAKINPQEFNDIIKGIIESGGGGDAPVEDLGFLITYPIEFETPDSDPSYRVRNPDVLSYMLIDWITQNIEGEKVPQEKLLGKFIVDGVEVQEIMTIADFPYTYFLVTGNTYGFDYTPSIMLYYGATMYEVGRIDVTRMF